MFNLNLAWKLFWRDWKSGELRILIIALWIAIGGLTGVTLLVDRIDRGVTREASQVLGADLVMDSPRPIDPQFMQHAQSLGLRTSETLIFSSVVVANDQFNLATIKATDAYFPLAGELLIGDKAYEEGLAVVGAPPEGEVWISSRLFQLFDLSIGDTVEIGVHEFSVTGVVITEPGGMSFFDFSPTIFMSLSDVDKTEIIQPGSRLTYLLDFAGEESALTEFSEWTEDKLDSTQDIYGAAAGSPALGSALGRAKNYLDLSGVLGLLLGGIAIAIAANRYAFRHFDHCALLGCIGLRRNQIVWIYSLVLLLAGVLGSLLGITTGYLINESLVYTLGDLLPDEIPAPNTITFVIGFVTGLVVLLGFSLPAMMRIRSIVPIRVLRKDIEPMTVKNWVTIMIALATLGLVLLWYARNLTLVSAIIVGGSLLTAISLLASVGFLKLAARTGKHRSIAFKYGIGHLLRHRSSSLIQISAFGLTLTLILTILLMRNELIEDWQAQLPTDAPNHFMVNILPEEVEPLKGMFQENNIVSADVFPMIRGRITAINNMTPDEFLGEDKNKHNSLERDLNLTWSNQLAASNTLLEGTWSMEAGPEVLISIEEEMATEVGLTLGDQITFDIAGQLITAEINSIRKVDWDSFEPNFYVIFNDQALVELPSTYITSFYMTPQQKPLLNDIVRQFPTVSVIELDIIMAEVRGVLDKATVAVEVVLVFIVFAGIAVLFATTLSSLDEKLYESAILKTLGANRGFVSKTIFVEYCMLGVLSGLLAAIASEGLAFALYEFVFKIDWKLHYWLWLVAPILGLLIIVPAGVLGNRPVLSTPPKVVLNSY